MKPGVVQHDHAALWQHGQQHFCKINVHHFGVATALKDQRGDQLVFSGRRNEAGAFPPFATNLLINPLASGRAARLTIEAVIHPALVQIKDGAVGQLFEFALEEPPLHLVALSIFCEFFLA